MKEVQSVRTNIYSWVHLSTPALGILIWCHCICVQDPRQLNLQLHGSILMEIPIDAIFIVCCRKDLGDDQLACSRDNKTVVSEIGVLEGNTRILLVDTNGVLDRCSGAGLVGEVSIEVVDSTFAVAAQPVQQLV